MSLNVAKIEKPKAKIDEIVLVTGETFTNAVLDIEAQRIPGFFAIRGQSSKNSVQYIAHSAVSSFTVRDCILDDNSFAYYISPDQKVKVTK